MLEDHKGPSRIDVLATARITRDNARFLKHHTPQSLNYAIHVSLANSYVFVEVPKVACSTIKQTLHRVELRDPTFLPENVELIHERSFSPLLTLLQVGPLERFLPPSDTFRFCFVRNPFDRLLSAYLDKIVGNGHQKRPILKILGRDPTALGALVSFEEFVDAVATQPALRMNAHWRVQWQHVLGDFVPYDFVGRFERFQQDFVTVLSRWTNEPERYIQTEATHRTDAGLKIGDHYDRRLADVVRRIYADDFERFGYSAELPR